MSLQTLFYQFGVDLVGNWGFKLYISWTTGGYGPYCEKCANNVQQCSSKPAWTNFHTGYIKTNLKVR